MDDSLTKQKKEFIDENDQFKLYNEHKKVPEALIVQASELARKKGETYNYFPFTHGTQIEQKQAMQRSFLKNVQVPLLTPRNSTTITQATHRVQSTEA